MGKKLGKSKSYLNQLWKQKFQKKKSNELKKKVKAEALLAQIKKIG
jgi:hypothetical protein